MVDAQRDTAEPAAAPAPEWTDRIWEQVWERTIGQPDRHRLAVALMRRQQPQDRLALRLLPELARRWRRTCVHYALGWGLFATFWAVLGVASESGPDAAVVVTPWWMAILGYSVVIVALGIRAWVRDMAGPPPGAG